MLQVIARVPAKINPVLSVGPRRPDGFHDLATVFHAVSLFDEVRAAPSDDLTITVSGAYADATPGGDANLAMRAARELAAHAGVPARARLSVRKAIPVAAGLAGGSADAAGALVSCAELWDLRVRDGDLAALAARLGSDVPFALTAGTAVGTGRGERLREVAVGGALSWVLAFADGGLSTPKVFARLDESRVGTEVPPPRVDDAVLTALATGDVAGLGSLLHNDLQEAAVALRPALGETLSAGDDLGALGGVVSGSGPTCAFLARDAAHADELVAGLRASGTCADAVAVQGPASWGG